MSGPPRSGPRQSGRTAERPRRGRAGLGCCARRGPSPSGPVTPASDARAGGRAPLHTVLSVTRRSSGRTRRRACWPDLRWTRPRSGARPTGSSGSRGPAAAGTVSWVAILLLEARLEPADRQPAVDPDGNRDDDDQPDDQVHEELFRRDAVHGAVPPPTILPETARTIDDGVGHLSFGEALAAQPATVAAAARAPLLVRVVAAMVQVKRRFEGQAPPDDIRLGHPEQGRLHANRPAFHADFRSQLGQGFKRAKVLWTAIGVAAVVQHIGPEIDRIGVRSEEHTSELQSPCNLVCRLLLEK